MGRMRGVIGQMQGALVIQGAPVIQGAQFEETRMRAVAP